MEKRRKNYLLFLTYKGSLFHGWQKQKSLPSVQQTLEEAISCISPGKISLTGCGRTDAGTHALSYTANIYLGKDFPLEKLQAAVNAHLPCSIRVIRVKQVPLFFHSRYLAAEKTYRYLIADRPSPFLEKTAWVITEPLDLKEMKQAASLLTGKHNFTSFQNTGSQRRDPVREIKRITFRQTRFTLDPSVKMIVVEITATGFLYKMARNIVGLLVAVGRHRLPEKQVAQILQAQDRKLAPPPAPAWGLYLKRVIYRKKTSRRNQG
ncbi:MAG: tRNA pseudouridine(38-40) synthase TruA [Candidatus Omnitrophica bacterium]|nr:tRNA pseudouridine(38-40) synthase TruA [Candidatus Omnitrophota bacterium]